MSHHLLPGLRRLLVAAAILCGFGWQTAFAALPVMPPDSVRAPKTVVLVHGYFADGSAWRGVIKILQEAGIAVVAVQNPLSSLAADAEAVRRVIDQLPGKVVLVGHSWGGMVITQAGVNPKVQSLVYVAAFAPMVGNSVNALQAGLAAPAWFPDLVQDDVGNLKLSQQGVLDYFAPDVAPQDAKVIAAIQGTFFAGTLDDPVTQAAWQGRPTWYIRALQDQIINPELEKDMALRIGARFLSVDSSHVVMISHPEFVAAVILEALGTP